MKTNRFLVLALAAALLPLWACEREEVTPPTGGSGSPQVEEPIIPEPEPEPDTVSLVGTVWKSFSTLDIMGYHIEDCDTWTFTTEDAVDRHMSSIINGHVTIDTIEHFSYRFNGHTLEGVIYRDGAPSPIDRIVYDTAATVLIPYLKKNGVWVEGSPYLYPAE